MSGTDLTSKMIVTRVGADTKKAGINRLFLCGRRDSNPYALGTRS